MKFSLLFFVLILSASFAGFEKTYAQTTTASTTEESDGFISNVLENVTQIKNGVAEQIQGDRDDLQSVLEKRTQERIINLAANISNRFDGIIARLQNIIDRLNKRIEKLSASGSNVDAARQSLTASQNALNNARSQMTDIDKAVVGAIGSGDPRAQWKNVRIKFIAARDSIKIAHAELRNTITNLKAAPQTIEAVTDTPITN